MMEKVTKSQIKLVKSLQLKKNRDELGLFVAEGAKCVEELRKSFELVHLYREGENASRTDIEQMSGLKTPQGIVGVFRKRPMEEVGWMMDDLVIALDGIQDPGNLGTILRTVDSANLRQIVISKETADVFNSKVVRSTMGAIFRINVIKSEDLVNDLISMKEHGFKIVVTALDTDDSVYDIDYMKKVIVIGNEANGVSKEVQDVADNKVKIPMLGKTESLNASVAAGIMIYEYVRKKVGK